MTKKAISTFKKSAVLYDLIRVDGRLERICTHGIGHTVGHVDPNLLNESYVWVHGCDGCCAKYERMVPRP